MTITPSTSRKWLRRGFLLVLILVGLFVIASGVFYGLKRSAERRWNELEASLRARGEPITYAEILADREPVPDDENGAGVIQAASGIMEDIEERDTTDVYFLDCSCQSHRLPDVSRRCLQPTREYIESRETVYTKLAKLREYPAIRFEVSYKSAWLDSNPDPLRHSTSMRRLGKLLHAKALVDIVNNDPGGAADTMLLAFQLTASLAEEPTLIARLTVVAMDWNSSKTLETLLCTVESGAETLSRLQREWERQLESRTMTAALRGARAWHLVLTDMERIKSELEEVIQQRDASESKEWSFPNPVDWIPFKGEWFVSELRVGGAEVLSRLIDASDDPIELLAVSRNEERALPRFSLHGLSLSQVLPSLTRSIKLHQRCLALFRCGPVALAAERFRMNTGQFPTTADQLVPEFLETVPADPYDGKPLRLATTEEGIVVYSVGENAVDDRGEVVPAEGERFGADMGMRLVRPELRRVRFIDTVDSDQE